MNCGNYAINVLSADQQKLSKRFAAPVSDSQFDDVPFRYGRNNVPLLDGCSAWLEVQNAHQAHHGDHFLFIGNVTDLGFLNLSPLVFHAGKYRELAAP